AAGAALISPAEAEAAKPPSKVRSVSSAPMGVTLELALDHAPFPCKGTPYTDPTVIVFVPSHYRAPSGKRLDAVVHFHGHNSTAPATIPPRPGRSPRTSSASSSATASRTPCSSSPRAP